MWPLLEHYYCSLSSPRESSPACSKRADILDQPHKQYRDPKPPYAISSRSRNTGIVITKSRSTCNHESARYAIYSPVFLPHNLPRGLSLPRRQMPWHWRRIMEELSLEDLDKQWPIGRLWLLLRGALEPCLLPFAISKTLRFDERRPRNTWQSIEIITRTVLLSRAIESLEVLCSGRFPSVKHVLFLRIPI